jgi:hypothetical protein
MVLCEIKLLTLVAGKFAEMERRIAIRLFSRMGNTPRRRRVFRDLFMMLSMTALFYLWVNSILRFEQ